MFLFSGIFPRPIWAEESRIARRAEFKASNEHDPFTSRGPDYDEAWFPAGDRYERSIEDRCSRALDFTDLDYVEGDEGE